MIGVEVKRGWWQMFVGKRSLG